MDEGGEADQRGDVGGVTIGMATGGGIMRVKGVGGDGVGGHWLGLEGDFGSCHRKPPP